MTAQSFNNWTGFVVMLWQLQKERSLSCVLEYYQEQGANTNKIINKCVPKRAGDKSHQRKPRKEKTTFEANQ